MTVGLIVPVMRNFKGFAELMKSVDYPVIPYVIDNWTINGGVASAWNEGLELAIKDRLRKVIICNDDVVLYKGTLKKLSQELDHKYFITACHRPTTTETSYDENPDFSCFGMRIAEMTATVGWFDENIYPAYFEDNDYAYRMKLAGRKHYKRLDAGMTHKGSVTQNMNGKPVVTSEMFERNREYYKTKWGGEPGKETYTKAFNK